MARRIHWICVGTDRYRRSRRHVHEEIESTPGQFANCRDILGFRREGSHGGVFITFRSGDGFLVAGGYPMHAGEIRHADDRGLNLNMPGVIRAFLDAAIARGWQPEAKGRTDFDGWSLFDAAFATATSGRYFPRPARVEG